MMHTTSLPPLSAGRKLGDKFEIVGVLGEGGTGIVYDARRLAENDSVALKVIHQHLAGYAQIRGRFTRAANGVRRASLGQTHRDAIVLDLIFSPELVGQFVPRRRDVVGALLRCLLAGERLLKLVLGDAVILEDPGDARLDR